MSRDNARMVSRSGLTSGDRRTRLEPASLPYDAIVLVGRRRRTGMTRPAQQLAGFCRVELAPGESHLITFEVAAAQLGYTNLARGFAVEPAAVDYFLGFDSDDRRLTGRFEIVGKPRVLASAERSFPGRGRNMPEMVQAPTAGAPARRPLRGTAAVQPIVPGFYPDPTICRVGPDYYLTHSSFEYFPGAPIFHSRDLITWSQLGHIVTRRTKFHRGNPLPSTGI